MNMEAICDAYQESFDELTHNIEEKIGVTFQDIILIADFIQEHQINKETALKNINNETAPRMVRLLWRLYYLEELSLETTDIKCIHKLFHNKWFSDDDLKEIINYAVDTNQSFQQACRHYESKIRKTILIVLNKEEAV